MIHQDAHDFVIACDRCQHYGRILESINCLFISILEVELFDVWGFDFIGPFVSSWDEEHINCC